MNPLHINKGSLKHDLLLYLHAVVDVVNHREAFSVLHALPVLRGRLSRANDPILALRGRDGEVLPGVGLGGDGIGLWTGRGGLVLLGENRNCERVLRVLVSL